MIACIEPISFTVTWSLLNNCPRAECQYSNHGPPFCAAASAPEMRRRYGSCAAQVEGRADRKRGPAQSASHAEQPVRRRTAQDVARGPELLVLLLFCVQQNRTGQTLPSTHEGNVVTAVVTLALYQLGYTDHATHRSVCRGCPVQQPWQGPFEPNLTHLIPSHPKPNMKHMAHSELITVPGICSDTSTVPFFSGLPGSNRL
jgi:hypothetical protein